MQIVSRKTWGAVHRAGFGARKLPVAEAWLHHSATAAPHGEAAERAAMRQLEKIGQQRFGAGVSYNLAVMPSGRVYEGCGVDRVGAHTARRNSIALGIVLVGNYDVATVYPQQRQALVDLLRHAQSAGWLTVARFAGGHRDAPGASTACPGRHAHGQIAGINTDAASSTTAPAPPSEEDTVFRAIQVATKGSPIEGAIGLVAPNYFRHVPPGEWAAHVAGGTVNPQPDDVSEGEWHAIRHSALSSDQL